MTQKPSYENMSDEQLVQLSLKDENCYYYLIERYETKILRYIHRATNVNKEDSEDLLQEIFIKIYRNLNGFNQKLKFSSWIYRIAHNEIVRQYHKNKSRKTMFSLNDEDDAGNILSQLISDEDICNIYESREKATKVREILSQLPNKYQEVLVFRYFEGQSYKEISDILRKPPGTVATLINRAKLHFKKMAKRHHLA